VALAQSDVCLQAFRLTGAPAWGIQFHAEVTREDLMGWLSNIEKDADALSLGLDPEAIKAESEERIRDWNEVGRGIASRFFAEVEASAIRA
jgi:GMP synthase-like glutamine amidotransferase